MTDKKTRREGRSLKPFRFNVAGIDIGGKEHWVCGPENEQGERALSTFGATTPELYRMAEWLREQGVESIAMESTYVYWIPVYEVLEAEGFEVILVNAKTLKHVPGRKTDVHDCQWIQLLHSCGLLCGSFRPKEDICRLRTLQRQRSNLVEERKRMIHWMQKSLDQMNVRVHRAVSNMTGITGMKIVRSIVAGERDASKLAAFRDKRCKKSEEEIAEHLTGTWKPEHLFNLKQALELFDQVEASIQAYDNEILEVVRTITPEDRRHQEVAPHPNATKARSIKKAGQSELREALVRFSGVDLTTIDGISADIARTVLTEIGPDIGAFPTEKQFVSWLRLCPRTPISGGKPVKRRKSSLGASRVGAAFRIAAVSIQRTNTAMGAAFRRIARRKSGIVAVFAMARKIAQHVYRLLRFGKEYVDIGAQAFEEKFKERRIAALRTNAEQLGLKITPLPAPAG